MAKKVWFLSLWLLIVISLAGVFSLKGFGREGQLEKRYDTAVISEKIDEILKNQQDIISRLKDIREELDIIRVRASRR